MNDKFTALAQANVDHFNDHPVAHTVITVVAGLAAVVVAHKLAKRMAQIPEFTTIPMPKSN